MNKLYVCAYKKGFVIDEFSVFSVMLEDRGDTIILARYLKFGALFLDKLDFEKGWLDEYYREATDAEVDIFNANTGGKYGIL